LLEYTALLILGTSIGMDTFTQTQESLDDVLSGILSLHNTRNRLEEIFLVQLLWGV
jgi:hypothetical protein